MIAADGKMHVFTVTECGEYDTCLMGIHDTSEGASLEYQVARACGIALVNLREVTGECC